MGNNFYQRLKHLSVISQKSINSIERELNYPRNALHNYRDGGEPSGTRVVELAHYFGVSPEYLLGEAHQYKTPSVDFLFQRLSVEERKEMCCLCYEWLLYQKEH